MLRITSEAMLLTCSLPCGGWTRDRPQLPDCALRAVWDRIGSKLSADKWPALTAHLQSIFSSTVLAEAFRQRLRKDLCSDPLPKRKSEPKKSNRGKKLATLVRQELKILRDRYAALVKSADSDAQSKFFCMLSCALPITERLIEEQIWRQHQIRLWRYANEADRAAAFLHVGGILDELCAAIDCVVTAGRSEPAYEQMARALAALYNDFVGKRPGRSWLDLEGTEGGPYIDLCRIMARAVNEALPANLRRPHAPDMAKPARRMADELKLELLPVLGHA